ncbi:hypothetical protein AN958_01646 [Leucoagaricus sp. SymC.cos]|nr:hypothetical protein AN958_01646 [Leucoagaricus sp. SymC.cos]
MLHSLCSSPVEPSFSPLYCSGSANIRGLHEPLGHHSPLQATCQKKQVLHVADLDVWVNGDGGTVIVIRGSGGRGSDPGSGISNAPDSNPSPTETEARTSAVDRFPTEGPTLSTTPITRQPYPGILTISTSTNSPTLMSESQAPSTDSLTATSDVANSPWSSGTISVTMPPSLSPSPSASLSANASTTFPTSPNPTSTDYLSHSPPFFVAIILGTIAGVAVLAAMIAWAFRRQAHEKRRRLVDSAMKLPWFCSAGGNDVGLGDQKAASDTETAMRTTDTEVGIKNLGSREGMAYVQSWEPRGDRDVGEPKRGESYVDRKPRPPFITQQIPTSALFSRYSGQHLISEYAASSCASRVSLGSIDPHLQVDTLGKGSALLITNQVPGDISVSSSQEVGFPCPSRNSLSPISEIGTPRELVPMPRFLGLDGKGLSIPWGEKDPSSNEGQAETATKSRIMSAEHIRQTWERNTSNHFESPSHSAEEQVQQQNEGEGWANSIRSNFRNAFNAVAASLPSAIREGKESSNSRLTPARPKQSSIREVLRHSSPTQGEANSNTALSRGCTIKSSASVPWSLVETESNAGVVHIHLPSSDVCSTSSHDLSDPSFGATRSYSLRTPEPLQIEKKSSTPLSKGRPSISSKEAKLRASFSRSSSASGYSPKRHRKPPGGSMKREITSGRRSSPLFSRTTSMASFSTTTSAVSFGTGAEDIRDKRLIAREALKDRRRKAKGLRDTPVEQSSAT